MSGWSQAILGCSGLRVTREERALYRDVRPWAFILFGRNVQSADQVRGLCEELRETIDDPDALVFIDQEGGRVQRLRPPLARQRKPAQAFGMLFQKDPEAGREAVRLNHRLIAHELRPLGVTADCAPCLDLILPQTTAAIGDRAFSNAAAIVAALGRAAAEGLTQGGVAPVIKHMPGHGRATVDSHLALPVVRADLDDLDEHDFAPFRAMHDQPMGMTAHLVFEAIDPHAPATFSPAVIQELIRDSIGFDGLLMTDDLSMQALRGPFRERAEAAYRAGIDVVLHCNGRMDEMRAVAEATPDLTGEGARRADAALARLAPSVAFDIAEGRARFEAAFDAIA